MNWNDIQILYWRELKSALRERSIVINSVLIPILLYPLLLWLTYTGMTFVSGQTSEMQSRIVLVDFPASHEQLKRELENGKRITIVNSSDPASALKTGSIDVIVRFDEGTGNNFRAHLTYDESRPQSSHTLIRIEQKLTDYRERYIQ